MKKHSMLVIALVALLAGGLTVSLAAHEEKEENSPAEFGSAMAKAHPDQARAMLAAAKKTYEATRESYDVGTETLANLHFWSRQLLRTERALANAKEEDLAAVLQYWKRTKRIYLRITALHSTGSRGGETAKFEASSFYLAEAELWLVAAGGKVPDSLD